MSSIERTLRRALRNLIRAPMRAGLMVALIAVGICLALIMVTVNSAFADRLDQIKATVGSTITVRPAGSGGGFFGGQPDGTAQTAQYLSADDLSLVNGIAHLVSYSSVVEEANVTTNLTAPVRQFPNGGNTTGAQINPNFQIPTNAEGTPTAIFAGGGIRVTGTDQAGPLQLTGGGTATVSAGRAFSADDASANVAIVGQRLADQNGLDIGSTFELEGETMTVVGIFSSDTLFGDNSIYLPLKTAQTLFSLGDQVSSIEAQVDSAENVDAAAADIRTTLGADNVDVATSSDQFDRIAGSLQSALRSSRFALITALAASAGIILFATVLATRQRIREIGILKAIGASGSQVILQFGVETLVVALIAGVIGALVTFPTAQSVANGLVTASSTSTGVGPGTGGRPFGGVGAAASTAADTVSVPVTPTIFIYAVLLALVLALLASAAPAWRVSKIRPAEVLRFE